MANVKIIPQETGIGIRIDDTTYNVVEWAVHQSSGEKPTRTFLAPMTVEVDSLELGLSGEFPQELPHEVPKFIE